MSVKSETQTSILDRVREALVDVTVEEVVASLLNGDRLPSISEYQMLVLLPSDDTDLTQCITETPASIAEFLIDWGIERGSRREELEAKGDVEMQELADHIVKNILAAREDAEVN